MKKIVISLVLGFLLVIIGFGIFSIYQTSDVNQWRDFLKTFGFSLVLSDPEALALVYQFVYWALRRDAVDINVPLIEASIGPMLSMDIMISSVGCKQPYTEDVLEITRMDWATLFIHLRECCGIILTDDINRFLYKEDGLHGKETSFVNCNVLFERND